MHFVVIREQGPGWDTSRGMREQDHWPEHVLFINGLADEGFLVLAGPVGAAGSGDGGSSALTGAVGDRVYRAMLIVSAGSEREVAARFENDPWTRFGQLETRSVEGWEILVGELA
jgi:uncharacterized protein YciI